jgi:hypothetical protein
VGGTAKNLQGQNGKYRRSSSSHNKKPLRMRASDCAAIKLL